eukprot:m.93877 g.93877  ORF g.93877 m.93877 type:complete len:272 (-) comp20329_c0_seq1:385-1200(-)
MSEVVAMDEGGGGGDSESPMLSRPETTTSEKAAEEHSAEVMADVVSATENQLQDAEDQSTDMMARVLSATDKQVDVEEVSRPGTSTSEQDAEEQSKAVMTRVLSATNMRISRLMSAGSRPSTRGGVVSAGSRPSTRGGKPSSTAGDGAHSAVWEQVETIVSDTCVSWQLSEGWKFCVKQVGQLESKYLIEAIFSIPTRRRPVPTATASVLFAVDMKCGAVSSRGVALVPPLLSERPCVTPTPMSTTARLFVSHTLALLLQWLLRGRARRGR